MHVSHILTLAVALAAKTVLGHMNMADPPPLRYKGNPNAVKAGKVDSDITSPNTAATFPCKGALPDLDDPVAGAPVATWYPGEQHMVQIVGGASHNGGSCQLSLSYDKGQTFTVVFSKIGACPTDPNIPFTLPADTPAADKVLFSWSWINHTGNREFYNNCAVLTIGAAKKKRAAPAVAFKDRPPMLVADIYHVAGAACVKEGVDALYPEPGPDFVNVSSSAALPDDCVSGQPLTANPVVGGSGGLAGGAPASGSASAPPLQDQESLCRRPLGRVRRLRTYLLRLHLRLRLCLLLLLHPCRLP
ncbi:HET-domain-containing protein [Apiospora arundinis]